MREWAEELVGRAREEGVALTGDEGLLMSMVREVLQAGLDVEMADHLGYEPYEPSGRGSGNSRNGGYPKTVSTDVGRLSCGCPGIVRARSSRSPFLSTSGTWRAWERT
jgi:putative transposase